MYVEKTKNGKYKCVMYVKDFVGKTKRISTTIDKDTKKNREEALMILNARKNKYYTLENNSIYFHDFLDNEYMKHIEQFKYITKAKNVRYANIIKKYSPNIKMNKINYKYCNNILEAICKDYAYNQVLKNLKAILNYAGTLGYIDNLYFLTRFKKKETPKKEILYLEKKDIKGIIKFYDSYDYAFSQFIQFLLHTGLRIGEALALTFDDVKKDEIDINKNLIHNTKLINSPKTPSSYRKVIANKEIINIINYQKEKLKATRNLVPDFNPSGIIFYNSKGTYSTYNSLQEKLSLYEKTPLNFHLFRHTLASLLIEKGVSVEAVARRLGHANTKITQEIYIHLTEKLKKKEDEIFKGISII